MKIKKWTGLAIAGSLLVVSACSNSAGTESSSSPTASPSASPTASAAPKDDLTKKFTVTFMQSQGGVIPPADGVGVKMINEKFNVDYKPVLVPSGEYGAKVSTTIAAGDMPDLMGWSGTNFVALAKQGAFLPLDEFINEFPSLKMVPSYVWDGVKVDGKIYGIPRYFPVQYGNTPIIRQDWLDKLGLKMPTNYEELKAVALAFTTKDPDGNGKNDTYGMILQTGIAPNYGMGAYWKPDAWYQKNKEGQVIPNIISDANKQVAMFLADLHKAGALPPDWATTNATNARNSFYAGKGGIYQQQPYDQGPSAFKSLRELQPEAKLVAIPPFKAPDGSQGYMGQPGWSGMYVLNGKLKDDKAKVRRILSILENFRTFIPVDQRNPSNKLFDWNYGGLNAGYKFDNNLLTVEYGKGLVPIEYMENRMWAPNDEANDVSRVPTVTDPLQKSTFASLEQMHKDTKIYLNPVNRVYSETFTAKFWALVSPFDAEVTKMIYGQRSFDDWDKIVAEFLANGGTQMIKEVNDEMKKNNIVGEFQ
ncbi:extracellular solute-binding protein [Paenibacillus koleovorans]|uniref:extracellular solute-binding protein n=1 Tax=Paenibacillus koleovorans TaxID=121608 RepID=UPI000FDC4B32|nr:extracellular solute-binding protein [Paenibacillus koleovorans]